MPLTTDPSDPELGRGPDTGPVPQNKKYLVLSDEVIGKARFVRPVREVYRHLTCGTETRMALKIAETYAADPYFYGYTYCVHCGQHFPVREFVWEGTNEKVGS